VGLSSVSAPTVAIIYGSEVLFVFAVIETGGKQYKVNEGDVIYVEKLEAADGAQITFDKVLAVSAGDKFSVGAPYVEGASVVANVIKTGKGKNLYVFKYKPKKNEKKKIGHRQFYTKVQIDKIVG
jgi:large subunit ribosomal protein L21